jgi:hypothetical protein
MLMLRIARNDCCSVAEAGQVLVLHSRFATHAVAARRPRLHARTLHRSSDIAESKKKYKKSPAARAALSRVWFFGKQGSVFLGFFIGILSMDNFLNKLLVTNKKKLKI